MRITTVRALAAVVVITCFVPVSFSQSKPTKPKPVNDKQAKELLLPQKALDSEFSFKPGEILNYLFSIIPGPIGTPPDSIASN